MTWRYCHLTTAGTIHLMSHIVKTISCMNASNSPSGIFHRRETLLHLFTLLYIFWKSSCDWHWIFCVYSLILNQWWRQTCQTYGFSSWMTDGKRVRCSQHSKSDIGGFIGHSSEKYWYGGYKCLASNIISESKVINIFYPDHICTNSPLS